MNRMQRFFIPLLVLALTFTLFAQGTESVTDTASVIGYTNTNQTVNVPGMVTVNFALDASVIELSALEVLANRATRETPVAYSNVNKAEMELRLGSQDIPMVLNTTPGVYATAQGGGAGDARVNVRGFNQRNVAIMINGVPVNDMENGWVYWSNWDGLGDATSSIQIQRGLSAVNLATPSIGGSMNIITDPAAHSWGGRFKQEVGAWGFLKSTVSFNTGLIDDKMAFSGTVVRKTGDGFVKGAWTDAWAYYFGASYALSSNDRLEFYALGAPQRHGQNLYKQNIARYSSDFANNTNGYDQGGIDNFTELGRDYNQNYNTVSSSYKGKQYWSMYKINDGVERFDSNFLNEHESYFHKPQVALNWYHTFTTQMRMSSSFYWSGGKGGGTETYGSVKSSGDLGYARDWDAEITENSTNVDLTYSTTLNRSTGILQNSVNQQWTIGAISKLYFDVNDKLNVEAGLDWRKVEIEHWREVRDLLGGDYYVYKSDDFDKTDDDYMKLLGDKIANNNTNTVDFLGFFGQGEFKSGPISAYGMAGWSTVGYTFTDHFSDDGSGKEVFVEAKGITGFQVKGGGMYRLSDELGFFANAGLVSKVPIFDTAINDRNGEAVEDPTNEKFQSIEAGVDFSFMDGMLNAKANYYITDWKDRSNFRGVTNEDGSEGYVFLTGMDANHSGIELEAAFQPMSMFKLDVAASKGNWLFQSDVSGDYLTYDEDTVETVTYNYYLDGLKIGDAPQTQLTFTASVFPNEWFTAQLVYKYYAKNYADWSPFSHTTAGDDKQSWMAPAYGLADFHAIYDLPFSFGGVKLQAFTHVFNLLDEEYIQDAVDNSRYNGWDKDHDADDAEVFFGYPRTWNVGINVRF